jgi:hypothetical protein
MVSFKGRGASFRVISVDGGKTGSLPVWAPCETAFRRRSNSLDSLSGPKQRDDSAAGVDRLWSQRHAVGAAAHGRHTVALDQIVLSPCLYLDRGAGRRREQRDVRPAVVREPGEPL